MVPARRHSLSRLALLYYQAYRRRVELGLGPLDALDARLGAGMHLVSVGVGALAIGLAFLAPAALAPSPGSRIS